MTLHCYSIVFLDHGPGSQVIFSTFGYGDPYPEICIQTTHGFLVCYGRRARLTVGFVRVYIYLRDKGQYKREAYYYYYYHYYSQCLPTAGIESEYTIQTGLQLSPVLDISSISL